MSDSTVKKIDATHSPKGDMGQKYLASGVSVSMRLWEEKPGTKEEDLVRREYETVGYVIKGRAELELEDQKLILEPGNSWLVPKNARHRYHIVEPFVAVEATSPPAHVHGRDE